MQTQQVRVTVIVLLLALASCVKNVSVSTPQAVQLRTAQALGVLVEVNKGCTAAAIQMSQAGYLTRDTTSEILDYNLKIATSVKSAFVVMDSSQTPEAKSLAVLAILKELTLPPKIQALVDNPITPTALQGLVSLIKSSVLVIQGLTKG